MWRRDVGERFRKEIRLLNGEIERHRHMFPHLSLLFLWL
jgi:hypothetical protein